MGYAGLKRLTVLIVAALVFSAGTGVDVRAQASSKGTSVAASSGSTLQEHFRKARERFLKKDYRGAASEIRSASAFLKNESTKAAGVAKEDLASSGRELDELTDRVQRKAVKSEKELDESFARAEYALAREYHEEASESWTKKETATAGARLKAAAAQLGSAMARAGSLMEEQSDKVIREAQEIGDRMEKNGAAAASDVDESLEAVGKEIKEGTRKAHLPGAEAAVLRTEVKPKGAVDLATAIVHVAQQTMPAVVYIEVTESRVVENPLWQFENNPFFQRFFNMPKTPRKFKQEVKGLGSGMIIDAQGEILTNYHVAGSAAKMQATLADGRKYPARLVGGDAKTDLAVIHISAPGPLPHVTFGDSDAVEVGEWVVAIGTPRALEKSVTQGIISAKHRTGITDPNSYQDFLQTDAPINPGDSGGPLLNLYGQVIGVNAAIATESGGFEGIGFTIPSKMAVYVANALMAHGKVERGWLGVSIRNLTPELAKAAHTETLAGALITEIVKGGPADRAGLKTNDIVIAYGDQEVPDSAAFRNAVAQTPVGSSVKLTMLREGKKEYATVVVGNLEEAAKFLAGVLMERLGGEVRPPTPKEVDRYGLNQDQGVMIARLDPKGPLAAAGFEVEDMILAINDEPVEGMEGFTGLVSALPPGGKASLTALDHRTGNTGNIFVTPR